MVELCAHHRNGTPRRRAVLEPPLASRGGGTLAPATAGVAEAERSLAPYLEFIIRDDRCAA